MGADTISSKAPGVFDGAKEAFAAAAPLIKSKAIDVATQEARKRSPNGTGDIAASAVSLLTGGLSNVGKNAGGVLNAALDFGVGKGLEKLKAGKNGAKIFKYASKLFGQSGETSYPIADLQKMYARQDPQLTFEFEVEMPDISPFYGSAGFGAIPDEYVEDIELPTDSIDGGNDVYVNARKIGLPGKISCAEFNVKFYAEHKHYVLRYLEAWKASTVTPKGIYNLPYAKEGGYMKPVKCHLKAGGTRVLTVELYGCWPTNRPAMSMQSATSDRLVLDQSFSCNGARLIFDPEQASVPGGNDDKPKSLIGNIGSQILKSVKKRL